MSEENERRNSDDEGLRHSYFVDRDRLHADIQGVSAELDRIPGIDGGLLAELQESLSDAREILLRVLEMIPDAPSERREHLAAQAASAIGMMEADIAAVVLAVEDGEGDSGENSGEQAEGGAVRRFLRFTDRSSWQAPDACSTCCLST
ncbi:hypothetical protein ACWDUC_39020 [Streptomyces tricolor]|uniref:hypothetical protein n=1 Tax=Streptomyces sp. EAS-AB2608 TaxID=2779671 RepID=UPI001BEFABA9|nr:hypothetical protein [Streptomyces sp. EAS-AB2608]BCM72963.1 hypothetical protein EASAB2608_08297 [Streptomyces sp. EAS-AB2608]